MCLIFKCWFDNIYMYIDYSPPTTRAALQIHDWSPKSRPVSSLNQSQTQMTRPVATGLALQHTPVHSSLMITNRSFQHAAPHLWNTSSYSLCSLSVWCTIITQFFSIITLLILDQLLFLVVLRKKGFKTSRKCHEKCPQLVHGNIITLHRNLSLSQAHLLNVSTQCSAVTCGGSIGECDRLNPSSWLLGSLFGVPGASNKLGDWLHDFSPWVSSPMDGAKETILGTKVA